MVHGGRVDIAGAKLLVMDKTRSFIACGSEGIGKRGRKFSVCQVCIYTCISWDVLCFPTPQVMFYLLCLIRGYWL